MLASSLLASRGLAASHRPLPVLPLRDLTAEQPGRIALTLAEGRHDFGSGTTSSTYGIDNAYFGPVLEVRDRQTLPFSVNNRLPEVTTLHWHGLHIPGNVDGGPRQLIQPGNTWRPDVPIRQRASLNWFHAHPHGTAGPQIYKGLAGVMIVEDDDSLAADLPRSYGVDDFVLVIQDKTFDRDGRLVYELDDQMREVGFFGDELVVNGALAGTAAAVPAGWLRLRLLNAANGRQFGIRRGDGAPFLVIASDGGFLDQPVETAGITIMPGERYELLVDCTRLERLELVALMRAVAEAEGDDGEGEDDNEADFATLFATSPERLARRSLVTFMVDPALPAFTAGRPRRLASLEQVTVPPSVRVREFRMNMQLPNAMQHQGMAMGGQSMMGMMGINGQAMDIDIVNERVRRGETELWRLSAEWEEHPFHVHGASFRILRQNGVEPLEYQRGWKDLVMVNGDAPPSEILVRFDHPADDNLPYMYHCHILEHEDMGMMGQFAVA